MQEIPSFLPFLETGPNSNMRYDTLGGDYRPKRRQGATKAALEHGPSCLEAWRGRGRRGVFFPPGVLSDKKACVQCTSEPGASRVLTACPRLHVERAGLRRGERGGEGVGLLGLGSSVYPGNGPEPAVPRRGAAHRL